MRATLISQLFVCVSLLCCASVAFSASIIDDTITQYPLGKDLLYLQEEGRILTLADILDLEFQQKFKKTEQEIPNFGMASTPYWAKISIDYRGKTESEWLIELDYIFLDKIEFYSRNRQGEYKLIKTGDTYDFAQREIKLQSFVFPVVLISNTVNDIYVRISTETTLQMPFILWQNQAFIEAIANQRFLYGIFYGAMFIMFFYNSMVYLSVRDPCYLYYLAFVLCNTMCLLSINGLGFEMLWPGSPGFQNISIPILMGLANTFSLLFARSFLMTKENIPQVDYYLKFLILTALITATLPLFISHAAAFKFAVLQATFTIFTLLSIGIFGVVNRQRRAYYFTLAWFCLCLGIMFKSANAIDLLPTIFITEYGIQLGALLEVVLLGFALADRINIERSEKLTELTQALISSDEQLTTEKKLIYQSLYDQMTLMPNRSLLIRKLTQHLNSADRLHDTYTLLCIHVNNVHDINNTLGHEVGDALLCKIVNALNKKVQQWFTSLVIGEDPDTGEEKYLAVIEGVYLGILLYNIEDNGLKKVLKEINHFF